MTVKLHCGRKFRTTRRALPRGSRVKLLLLAASVAAVLIAPSAAMADAALSPGLAEQAAAHPHDLFKVIVQGQLGRRSHAVGQDVKSDINAENDHNNNDVHGDGVRRQFVSVNGVSAQLTGREILRLAHKRSILAISIDQPVRITSGPLYTSKQRWPYVSGVAKFWNQLHDGNPASMANPPTIAVIDSGVDPTRPDLAGRVLKEVNFTSLPNNSPHDGRGHGTFVASIAAGSGNLYAGVAPNAKIVSIDVVDDTGMGMSSDVIAAADWILANKATYNIRVANFSLHGSQPSTVPLRSAQQGGREALVQRRRRRRGSRQLRRHAVRRPLFARQRSVRDHRRRRGHRRLDQDERRLCGTVVGLRLHARRLCEARDRGPRPLHGRCGASERDAPAGAPGSRRRPGLPADVGNLVRDPGRGRHGGVHPRPPPKFHSGPGEGRAHGDRAPHT